MNATPAKELKAQVLRLWDRGELLRDLVTGHERFPLRLSLKLPDSADVSDRFDEVRLWVAQLVALGWLRLEWQVVRHRVQGLQKLPSSAWVDTAQDALNCLGKRREADRFAQLLERTRREQLGLLPWLARRPLQALALADDWPRLLKVVAWQKAHPRPAIYLRQVDVPGVHSKFMEGHRGVLAELFDLVLPAEAVESGKTGVQQFAARYGFLDKPLRIRLRVLDAKLAILPGITCPDITLDANSFTQLKPPVKRVFITENETNFLAFPGVADAIVVFGSGYGWDSLAACEWLNRCAVVYWGDIDTHGFGILDQLRAYFPHVESFLMDRDTLHAHDVFWGHEDKPLQADLQRLTPVEKALYEDLRNNRIRVGLRLEQEHIGFGWLTERLNPPACSNRAPPLCPQTLPTARRP